MAPSYLVKNKNKYHMNHSLDKDNLHNFPHRLIQKDNQSPSHHLQTLHCAVITLLPLYH